MLESNRFYERLENNFISWAQTVEEIRAAFIVGSRARNDHPADKWSDLDIIFFTSKPNDYLFNNEWLKNFGNVWTSFVSETAGGDPECLALFDGGRQVDFVIHSLADLKQIVKNKIVPDNFYRGVRVILDKDHVAKAIMPQQIKAPQKAALSESDFLKTVNLFWFVALYMAKQILRNELWVVKIRDGTIKELLLQMIEWHEKAENGNEYDTWHAGRFLCEWASKETLAELQTSFGHFDRRDSWKALKATITLFQRLSHNISQTMNFSYPYDLERNVLNWITQNSHLIPESP